ncbi:MAG TPA: hypothetical protein VLG12_06975 [Candidatus Saccharimonadales bacterium]|nr:hypothetical protein [Candidatus Saccharimonadales bacterium]
MIYRPQQPQRSNKTFLAMLGGFLVVGALGVSVWFLRQQTVTNQHASASTTLAFNNASQTVTVGQSLAADITVNPGNNQVSIVKVSITYDGSKLQASSGSTAITVNQSAFPQTLQSPATSCNGTQCTLSATYSISSPTQVIQSSTTLGTVHFKALATTGSSTTQVAFGSASAAYSTATLDNASANILSSTSPLAVTINTAGSTDNTCHANQSTCSWDALSSAASYHYKVIETGSGTVLQESDVTAPQTSATFASEPGKTYTCTVAAVNVCGKGNTGSGTSTCPALTATPSPSQSPTPTTCSGPGTVSNLHIICPNCNNQAVNQ